MAKIHISPNMIGIMVKNAKSSEQIQQLYDLVKKSAAPYQLSWIMEQKIKMQMKERQEQETKQ